MRSPLLARCMRTQVGERHVVRRIWAAVKSCLAAPPRLPVKTNLVTYMLDPHAQRGSECDKVRCVRYVLPMEYADVDFVALALYSRFFPLHPPVPG